MIRSCRSNRYSTTFQAYSGGTLLIIVNFHDLYFSNIEYYDEEYFPTFCSLYRNDFDVLYVGTQRNNTYRVVDNGLSPGGGWFSYHSAKVAWDYIGLDCIDQYIGMLFMNDDSYIDPVNLNDMNPSYSYYETTKHQKEKNYWCWWTDKKYNGVSFEEAFNKTISVINTDSQLSSVCGEWIMTPTAHGWSDFFYITNKQILLFLHFESVMFKYRNFLEIAVYNILKCFTNHAINSCNHIGCFLSDYEYLHIHPFKYSRSENRIAANRLMTRNYSRYDRVVFSGGRVVMW